VNGNGNCNGNGSCNCHGQRQLQLPRQRPDADFADYADSLRAQRRADGPQPTHRLSCSNGPGDAPQHVPGSFPRGTETGQGATPAVAAAGASPR